VSIIQIVLGKVIATISFNLQKNALNLEKSQTKPDPHRVSDLNILSLKLELEQTVPGGWIIQPLILLHFTANLKSSRGRKVC